MLRRIVGFMLVLCIGWSQCTQVLTYLNFKINQDYIAKELCENKEVPKMNCNGKCYLAKQLAKQEKEEEEKAPVEQRVKLDMLYCYEFTLTQEGINIPLLTSGLTDIHNDALQNGYRGKIFQPPQFS